MFLEGLRRGLSKTHERLLGRLKGILSSQRGIDEGLWEELEEVLVSSDVGIRTTEELLSSLRKRAARKGVREAQEIYSLLREEVLEVLKGCEAPWEPDPSDAPQVVMVLGANGVGKTTLVGKLAHRFASEGWKVIIAAADTFRAAAIEQLEIWAERASVPVIRHREGADPSAVAYDALEAASARGYNLVLVDTAGRLHTKGDLIEELKKMRRVLGKKKEGAPHEVLLVLDATTGQNAIVQARTFTEALGVTGLALTKLDGTARGGVIVAIARELALPVRWLGTGEGIEDLLPFSAEDFTEALFGPS